MAEVKHFQLSEILARKLADTLGPIVHTSPSHSKVKA